MRGGLVGDDVDRGAHGQHPGQQLGGVAEQADGQRLARVPGRGGPAQRVVHAVGGHVQVAVLDPAGDPGRVAVDDDGHAAVHGHRERLGAAHAAQPGGQRDRAGQRPAEPLGGHGRERLVGALQDALGADVDPRPGGHLAVHGQAERLQAAELLPGGPLRDQVGVGDEHPRRPFVGAHHPDRLARLDQQGLVALEVVQGAHDRVVGRPAAGRAARAAVHDELVGMLGHLGIEVVHQHPHGRLLRPALAGQGGAARGTDRARAGWVVGSHRWLLIDQAPGRWRVWAGSATGGAGRRHGSSSLVARKRQAPGGAHRDGEPRPAR